MDSMKFNYDWQTKAIDDEISNDFLWFCALKKKYPTTLVVPLINSGYTNLLLRTRIDRALRPGQLVMEAA